MIPCNNFLLVPYVGCIALMILGEARYLSKINVDWSCSTDSSAKSGLGDQCQMNLVLCAFICTGIALTLSSNDPLGLAFSFCCRTLVLYTNTSQLFISCLSLTVLRMSLPCLT